MTKENKKQTNDDHSPPPRCIEIDIAKYVHYLDDLDLTPNEKEQALTSLWIIMQGFVDLGFGLHMIENSCGKPAEIASSTLCSRRLSAVDSLHPIIADSLEETASMLAEKARET